MPIAPKPATTTPASAPVETPAEEIRRLNGEYRAIALRADEIEGILRQKYDMDAPKVPKAAKVKTGLITEEIAEKVREYLSGKPKGINNTEFTRLVGLYGISGLAEVNSARTELVTRDLIVVEEVGTGTSGRGSAKVITLVEASN